MRYKNIHNKIPLANRDTIAELHILDPDLHKAELVLIKEEEVIDRVDVPITEHIDSMLIKTLDKLLQKNKIKALSLKTLDLRGKMRQNSLSEAVLKAIKAALDY